MKAAVAILGLTWIVKNRYVRRNIQPFRVALLKIYYKRKDLFRNKDSRMNTARKVSNLGTFVTSVSYV